MVRRALLAAALLLASHLAHAQGTDAQQAEALFRDATSLVATGNYDEACRKLEQSDRLDPAIGTKFNLAVCLELSGRLARAARLFREVAAAATAAGKTERAKTALERSAALESRLPRL